MESYCIAINSVSKQNHPNNDEWMRLSWPQVSSSSPRTSVMVTRHKSTGDLTNCLFHEPTAKVLIPCFARLVLQELTMNCCESSIFDGPPQEYWNSGGNPSIFDMIQFLHRFHRKGLTTHCIVAVTAYLARIKESVKLSYRNWRRLLLVAFIIAEKSIVDARIWNEDYHGIVDIDLKELLKLEKGFLKVIQFHLTLSMSDYAKFYFALVSLQGRSDNTQKLKKTHKRNSSPILRKL